MHHLHNATRKPTIILLLLTMASLLSLFLLSLLLSSFPSYSESTHRGPLKSRPRRSPRPSQSQQTLLTQACQATRFPDACLSSLANSTLPPNPATVDVIRSAISLSLAGLSTAQSMAQEILDSSAGNVNRSNAARNCLEVLADSRRRAESTSGDALTRGGTKDARAWMSASLLFQYDCSNALKYANDTALTAKTMSFLDSLMELTSNALSMAFALDTFGNDTAAWAPPKTERDGFWGWAGHLSVGPDGRGTPVGSLTADVTVCKDGGGCHYGTVQEAVNAAPENLQRGKRFVIGIKAGVYEEVVRVPMEKRNLVLLGDGRGKTVISSSLTAGPGISTYNTATVAVLGDGFMARGLTIQNTAPPPTHQAVAFRCDSDLSVMEDCEFLGNQDTLYAHSLRQYYRSCHIEGNVDFIFGNSAAVFEDCVILVSPRQVKPEKGETNAVTAHGRTDPAQSTGFVFLNCLINGTDEYMALFRSKPSVHKNYLGRPWKEYSRTVFINSTMEAIINPQGWLPWTGDFALKTLYYGEFGNTGPGSDTSQRVSWSSQIPAEHVNAYSIGNFIQGDDWIPTSS